jgi:hypothetical protein
MGIRLISFFWWLARHRLTRRVLLWIVVRLIRRFGLRRSLKLLFGGRRRWRFLALGAWRAAVMLLRVGRTVLRLAGPQARARRGLDRRTPLTRRLARRRDRIRRSVLAAAGVDPNWRPPSRRGLGAAQSSGELTPPS